MRQPSTIEQDATQIATVEDLTGVFESIASTQVAKVKNKVKLSKEFFRLIWSRYSALRIDPNARITSRNADAETDTGKSKVFVIISAEAGLSGDIDQRLVDIMMDDFDEATTDVVVLGSHGANQLKQRGVSYIKFFKVPESDEYIDVSPVIDTVFPYSSITVYYEEYVSLGVQKIKKIDLISNIKEMSEEVEDGVMTDEDTIFEPSIEHIAKQMELTMMTLAFSETILESSLAQAASRFNAMAVAKDRAGEMLHDYKSELHKAKRSLSDRRMREVLVSLKKKSRGGQTKRRRRR